MDAAPTDGSALSGDASRSDGGVDAEVVDAAGGTTTDAALDQSAATSTPPPIIADGGGCTPNNGTLCGASQPYGVTCIQSSVNSAVPEPPPSLECAVADAPTPTGTLYYCCSIMPPGDTPVTPIP